MSFLDKFFGNGNTSKLKKYEKIVEEINSLEEGLQSLSDKELQAKTEEFRGLLKEGKTLDDILPEAFAVVREAAKRTLGQRHYDVQMIGGQVLHNHSIAEMRTGEGKTLVATLPTYLNAIGGKGVHVITVNDYLARRDAAWMGQIYKFLGLSVGVIDQHNAYIYDESHTVEEVDEKRDETGAFEVQHDLLRPVDRKEAYLADITYGVNAAFGFDYLRDNIQHDKEGVVQRGFNYAVIDEVDSILIDDARTPLILSAPVAESESLYGKFAQIANNLKEGEDFTKDEKTKSIQITEAGIDNAERALGIDNIYTERGIKYVHHLETAVKAKALFHKEQEYVVKDGEVTIVDPSTGRLQPGRRWSEGLHQAIEAKEGVRVQQESRTFASVTYQNFFRMYNKLAGMTGTAETSSEEFYKVYGLEVLPIPTNLEIQRIDHNDQIYQTEMGKFKAVARKVKELNETGQPVLIGTASIEKNELLSAFLQKEGIKHTVLNAKKHEEEGQVIAQAGQKGAVTVATNMAGRGIDIILGGAPRDEAKYEEVKSLGGLFVLGTERHEARRTDNQLRGRAGRQGDPGGTQFFVSLEDPLMRIFASDTVASMMKRFNFPEDQAIENKIINRSLESAQTKVEGFHFDGRKHVLEYDDVLNHQRNAVYKRRNAFLFGTDEELEEELAQLIVEEPKIEKLVDQKKEQLGKDFYRSFKSLGLQVIDMLWVDHLEQMNYMREAVRLRAYGQRDPLIEYKKEGLRLFRELEGAINGNIIHLFPNTGNMAKAEKEKGLEEVHKAAQKIGGENKQQQAPAKPQAGRNDPCPCGSGKKYKKCHGA